MSTYEEELARHRRQLQEARAKYGFCVDCGHPHEGACGHVECACAESADLENPK